MKKLLSVILSVLLVCGCLSNGLFALADDEVIQTDEVKTVNITTAGEAITYRFTPQESGLYVFYTMGSEDTFGYFSGTLAYSDDNSYDGKNFFISRNIPAGTACTIKVKLNDKTKTGSFSLTVFRSEAASFEIVPPAPVSVNEFENGSYETSYTQNGKVYKYSYPLMNFANTKLRVKNADGDVIQEITLKGYIADSIQPYFIDTQTKRIPFLFADEADQLDTPWGADKTNLMNFSYLDMFSFSLPITVKHVFSSQQTVAPTCTAKGYQSGHCSKCNKDIKWDYQDALGHDFGDWTVTAAAACTQAGTEQRYCSRCDAFEERALEALGHDFGDWTVTAAAACTQAGTEQRYCSRCDAFEERPLEALGHSFGDWVTATEPTCTEKGSEARYCSRCDAFEERELAALGHDFGDWEETAAPTCTENGTDTRYCSRCDALQTNRIPALGHVPGEEQTENRTEPTCTRDGAYDTAVYCERCEAELSRQTTVLPAIGHDWGDWVVVTEPTEDSEGLKKRVCTHDASHVETLIIPELTHVHTEASPVIENEKAPTCTEKGSYETVIYCVKNDGYEFSRVRTTVPALGHVTGEEQTENRTEPICTQDGAYDAVVYCTRCGEELSRETVVLPATGHTAGDAVRENETAPGCETAGGYDTVTYCTACGTELSRVHTAVAAVGHDFALVDHRDPTCTEKGYSRFVCQHDASHVKEEKIPALGHIEGEERTENRTEPTCARKGSYDTAVYCERCGEELSRTTVAIPALAHQWDGGVITEKPTVQKEGVRTYTCSVCGGTRTEAIAKLPAVSLAKAKVSGIKAKTYTGKKRYQKPTVVLGGKTLEKNKDYRLVYSGNVAVGTATVRIVGIGDYTGTITRKFNIRPKKTKILELNRYNKGVTVKWKKITEQATGYRIQYARKADFKKKKTVTVKGRKTAKKAVTGLKKGKTYYFRVQTYHLVNGKKIYSAYSKVKKITA